MKKKWLLLFSVVMALTLVLAACGNSDSGKNSSGDSGNKATDSNKTSDSDKAKDNDKMDNMDMGSDKKSDSKSDQSSEGDKATTLNVTATNFKYNKDTFEVPANKEITINLKSDEGYHGFKIEGTDVNLEGKGTAKVTLKPGTYNVHCSIPCGSGHKDMKAKIVAK